MQSVVVKKGCSELENIEINRLVKRMKRTKRRFLVAGIELKKSNKAYYKAESSSIKVSKIRRRNRSETKKKRNI